MYSSGDGADDFRDTENVSPVCKNLLAHFQIISYLGVI